MLCSAWKIRDSSRPLYRVGFDYPFRPMLIGYVSDERYTAVADALLEFSPAGEATAPNADPVVVRSSPRGGVYAELPLGEYRVTLSKSGYGPKTVTVQVDPRQARPQQFRLLSDGLLGYVWPRWVRAGERGEFRVHSVEPYRLTLWRYGKEK